MKEWQKLKKMTSMLLWHPGFEVSEVCLSSWVMATAAIGVKTKEKIIIYHIDHIVR